MHVRDGDRAHGWRWQRRRRGMSIGAVTSIRSMDLDTLVCVESIMPCQSGRRCAPASSPAGTVNGDGEARRAQPQGEGDVWVCGVKSEVHLAVCGVRKVVPYNGPPLTQSLSRLVVAQRKVTPGACSLRMHSCEREMARGPERHPLEAKGSPPKLSCAGTGGSGFSPRRPLPISRCRVCLWREFAIINVADDIVCIKQRISVIDRQVIHTLYTH